LSLALIKDIQGKEDPRAWMDFEINIGVKARTWTGPKAGFYGWGDLSSQTKYGDE